MNYHTPFLKEIILLCAIIFPSSVVMGIPKPKQPSLSYNLLSSIGVYLMLIILIGIVAPEYLLFINFAPITMYFLAPLAGLFCIFLEYFTGALQIFCKHGMFPKEFMVHSFYDSKVNMVDIFLIVILVIGEELILRQTLFSMLLQWRMQIWLIIVLCAVIYGFNHLFFGIQTVPQKIISGLVYTSLYFFSGMSLIVPIIAHSVQNLTLWVYSKIGGRLTKNGKTAL